MNNKPLLECIELSRHFADGAHKIEVIKKLNFKVNAGERIAIVGPSGSGKSTLLHLLGGLDKASSGVVKINNTSWYAMSEPKRCALRNQSLGFVYQFHHLLPEFSALENVAIPLLLGHASVNQAQMAAKEILNHVGLSHRLHHKPGQLSGGERQRVAIARALVQKPACILADEPTGNLDQVTAHGVFDLMLKLNEQLNTALVIVTHDHSIAARMDTIYTLEQGILMQSPSF